MRKRKRTLGSRGRSQFDKNPGACNRGYSPITGQGYRAYQENRHDEGSTKADHDCFGKGPKGYRRSDEKIYDEVCEFLAIDDAVDATEIEVEVADGVVSLCGAVENRKAKKRAAEIAASVFGVIEVRNELHILSHDSVSNLRSPEKSTDSIFSKLP